MQRAVGHRQLENLAEPTHRPVPHPHHESLLEAGILLGQGAQALLDEVTTGKITGEEERYSHTDLWDFRDNLQGSQSALETLRPVVTERDPALQKTLDARFGELNKVLESHRVNGRFVSYTKLSKADIRALTVSLDALGKEVSKVPAVV